MPLNRFKMCEELVCVNYGGWKKGIIVSVEKRYLSNPSEKKKKNLSYLVCEYQESKQNATI